jgi:hypothetical protein
MTRIGRRIQTATAACAIAVAAVLMPAPVAHAAPATPLPLVGIGSSLCAPVGPLDCASLNSLNPLNLSGSIFQNRFWWFGAPNPTPPPQTTVFEFYPLALVPGFLQPLFGWFGNINYEACIGGLTLRIGPYGTVSGSYSRGCA